MNMMNREANSNVIPEDLIIEIFSRLPQKSISRFLCLSKQWKSILCSQYFTNLFYAMSSSKPHLLILRERKYELDWKLFSSHQPMSESSVATSFFHAKFSEYHISYKGYFEGSYASGLIYFPGDGEEHGICNPSTKQYVILPPIKHPYGFLGFDPIGKQFKVLLYKEKCDDEVVYHVLTLGTKNERQIKEVKCPLTYGSRGSDHICINGVLYYETHDFEIGCFVVSSEKFFKFQNPFPFGTLVNYRGKLGLVYIYVSDTNCYGSYYLEITIWVLEDFDKVEWTEHVYKVGDVRQYFSRGSASDNLSVIGVTDSGDIVLAKNFARKPFYVYFFNPGNTDNYSYHSLRCVRIKGGYGEEENSDNELYRFHYFMNHRANLEFDIMKKTTYGETCMYEPTRTEASTSSN